MTAPNYPFTNPTALEPPVEWDEYRSKCPVAHVSLPSGDEAVLVTRYDDVRQVLADPRFERSAEDAAQLSAQESGGVLGGGGPAHVLPQSGEGHQRWRRRLSGWFTAKRMAALRPVMQEQAELLVDSMIEQGDSADLKAQFGFPLPVWVICDMLGVPNSDRERFAHWSDGMLNMTRFDDAELARLQGEFVEYMGRLVAEKRAQPGSDLLSELAETTDDGRQTMSDEMLVATGQALLVAGHETTANMIAKMVAMLLADRSRWEQLLADRSLIPSAVEEVLRFDANPGVGMTRYLTEELELSEGSVPEGSTVMCSMGAANRDGSAFDAAAEMDLARRPNPHVAFGAGPHSCLGQALARTELQVSLAVLLDRLPTLRLATPADELQRIEGLLVGGLRTLPVTW